MSEGLGLRGREWTAGGGVARDAKDAVDRRPGSERCAQGDGGPLVFKGSSELRVRGAPSEQCAGVMADRDRAGERAFVCQPDRGAVGREERESGSQRSGLDLILVDVPAISSTAPSTASNDGPDVRETPVAGVDSVAGSVGAMKPERWEPGYLWRRVTSRNAVMIGAGI